MKRMRKKFLVSKLCFFLFICILKTREAILYGFERVAPTTMEEMQTTSAALATLAEKDNELSQAAQVIA